MINSHSVYAAAFIGLVASLLCEPLSAQSFPSKPIKIIVPAVAGSTTDLRARLVGQKMASAIHQPVVIDNRAGANGAIAAQEAARAAPDGYTLFMGNINNALNDLLKPSLTNRLNMELVPVTRIATGPLIMVVNPAVPAVTLKQYLELARAKPNSLTYASGGAGSLYQLLGEMIKTESRVEITEVPYKSTGAEIPDLLAGHVMTGFNYASVIGQHIRNGKLRALAVASSRRIDALPDIPTMAEAGLPGVEATGWNGIFVPANTPQPVIRILYQELVRALNSPEIKEQVMSTSAEIGGERPEEFAAFIRADMARWEKVIRDANIKTD